MKNRHDSHTDREALERLYDGELPESERRSLEERLAGDEAARRELDGLRRLGTAIRAAYTPETLPALTGMETRVRARISGAEKRSIFGLPWRAGWKWGFGGAGVAMAAVLCFVLVWRTGQYPATSPGGPAPRPTLSANGSAGAVTGTPFKETIESDGTIYITRLPDTDIEIVYIFDVQS